MAVSRKPRRVRPSGARVDELCGSLAQRLVPPMPGSALWGWAGPFLVTLFGAFLRFNRLSVPHAVLFDETYYVPDAYGILRHGVEIDHVSNVNALLTRGKYAHPGGDQGRVRGPPAARQDADRRRGVAVRADAVRLAVRGGGGGFAGHPDDSADRAPDDPLDAARLRRGLPAGPGRAGVRAEPDRDPGHLRHVLDTGRLRPAGDRQGPDQGPPCSGGQPGGHGRATARLPLAAAAGGLCLGCACATKWNGVWYVPAFAALVVAWDVGARRAAGFGAGVRGMLRSDAPWLPLWFAVVPAAVYVCPGPAGSPPATASTAAEPRSTAAIQPARSWHGCSTTSRCSDTASGCRPTSPTNPTRSAGRCWPGRSPSTRSACRG